MKALILFSVLQILSTAQAQTSPDERICYSFGSPLQIYPNLAMAKEGTKTFCDLLMPKQYNCDPGHSTCVIDSETWDEVYPGKFTWIKYYTNYRVVDLAGDIVAGANAYCGLYVEKKTGDECNPPPELVNGYNLLFQPEALVGTVIGPQVIGSYEKQKSCPEILGPDGNFIYNNFTTIAPIGYSSADFSITSELCTEKYDSNTRCNSTSCNIVGTFHPSETNVEPGITAVYSEFLFFLNNWDSFFGSFSSMTKFQLEGFIKNNIASPPPPAPAFKKKDLSQAPIRCPIHKPGSIIDVDNQILGENIPLFGTPYSIYYYSDRVLGRQDKYKLRIPLVRGKVPNTLSSIELTILFAGRDFTKKFVPNDDLYYDFFWDGLDASGNAMPASTEVVIVITSKGPGGTVTSHNIQRLGGLNIRLLGLNGWGIDIVHFYDKGSKILYLGQGGEISNTGVPYEGGFAAPSIDGSELYIFNSFGKHIKTINAITGDLKFAFSYGNGGGIVSIVDRYGNKTLVQHLNSSATKIIAPNGQETNLEVDSNGWMSKVHNPNNEVYTMTYRSKGLLSSFQKPEGQKSFFNYDALGFLINDQTDAGNWLSLFKTTNEDGWAISSKTAEGREEKFELNPDGQDFFRFHTNSSGVTSSTFYKFLGESQSVSAEGLITKKLSVEDARFNSMVPFIFESSTAIEGTDFERIERTEKNYSYLNNNIFQLRNYYEKRTVEGDDLKSFITTFDNANRIFTFVTPEGRRSVASLNEKGDVASTQNGTNLPIQITYDSKGRTTAINQGERSTRLDYDSLGNISQSTDVYGKVTSFKHDPAGRVIEKILPNTMSIKFTYDKNGNVTSISPPQRNAHIFSLNLFEFISAYLPPLLNGKSTSTEYTYNLDKQLTNITRPDGKKIQFNYNQNSGKLSSILSDNGEYQYSYYDESAQLARITSPDNVATDFEHTGPLLKREETSYAKINSQFILDYHKDFSLKSITVGDGTNNSVIQIQTDKDNLPIKIGNESLNYNSNGALEKILHTNIHQEITRDEYGEVIGEKVESTLQKNKKSILYKSSMTRDLLGRVVHKSETLEGKDGPSLQYVYDTNDRLVEVLRGAKSIRKYVYDPNGNRIKFTEGNSSIDASYDEQDRLLSYGKTTYKYNDYGDLAQKIASNGKIQSFEYDTFGNLKRVVIGKDMIEYIVDGQNRRVGKKINGALVQAFIYQSQTQIAAELNGDGVLKKRFVYGSKINIPDYYIENGKEYKIISDQVGTPKMIIDTALGKVIAKYEFDEFGNQKDNVKMEIPFGFAGGLFDIETRLIRFGARDYDAEVGRWTSKDPIGFHGGDANLYGYVLNNPVNLTDPNGTNPIALLGPALAFEIGYDIGTFGVTLANTGSFSQSVNQVYTSSPLRNLFNTGTSILLPEVFTGPIQFFADPGTMNAIIQSKNRTNTIDNTLEECK